MKHLHIRTTPAVGDPDGSFTDKAAPGSAYLMPGGSGRQPLPGGKMSSFQ